MVVMVVVVVLLEVELQALLRKKMGKGVGIQGEWVLVCLPFEILGWNV